MMKPKVVHITTVAASLKGLLLNQLLSIREQGYEVMTISAPGPEVKALHEVGIPHLPIEMTRRLTPLQDCASLWQLYKVMRREQFTIVHTHNPKPGLLGQLAAKLAGVPIIVNTVHGFYFHDHMRPAARRFYVAMEKVAARCSDSILSQNLEDLQTALREKICREDQIQHLGNGIDLTRFSPGQGLGERAELERSLGLQADTPVVGFVGRLTVRKGFYYLLEAARRIAEQRADVRFLIIGPKDEGRSDAIDPAEIERYGLKERCLIVGEQPNERLPAYYQLMDVLVLPSPFEGIPRAVMEAAAMGVPAVVSDVKGNREAVWQEENGLLVPYADSTALADALLRVLSDKTFAEALGKRGVELAKERFDERKVFHKVVDEYQRLLADTVVNGERVFQPAS